MKQLITKHLPFTNSSIYKTLSVYRRALPPLLVNMHADRLIETKQETNTKQAPGYVCLCVQEHIFIMERFKEQIVNISSHKPGVIGILPAAATHCSVGA